VNPAEESTRRAEPGELCVCGRQASIVITGPWGDVGACSVDGGGQRPVLPCPFCGATEAHMAGGEVVKCPQYRLRVLDDLSDEELLERLVSVNEELLGRLPQTFKEMEAADAIHRDALLAWLKSYVQDDKVPDVLVAMYEADGCWERDRPDQTGDWWPAYQQWQRVRNDEATGFIHRLRGNVDGYLQGPR
jgi:hypothetical protein